MHESWTIYQVWPLYWHIVILIHIKLIIIMAIRRQWIFRQMSLNNWFTFKEGSVISLFELRLISPCMGHNIKRLFLQGFRPTSIIWKSRLSIISSKRRIWKLSGKSIKLLYFFLSTLNLSFLVLIIFIQSFRTLFYIILNSDRFWWFLPLELKFFFL